MKRRILDVVGFTDTLLQILRQFIWQIFPENVPVKEFRKLMDFGKIMTTTQSLTVLTGGIFVYFENSAALIRSLKVNTLFV